MINKEDTIEPSILTHELDAPRELVYEVWTRVEHLCNWQFPMPGFKCEFVQKDISVGGKTLHKMIAPNGFEMWLLTVYEELNPPGSLVFRQYMSNQQGDKLPNPRMPGFPQEMRTTIVLEEENGKTKLQLIWQPIDPSEEEAQVFEASRSEHGQGWGGGLDQLAVYLNTHLNTQV